MGSGESKRIMSEEKEKLLRCAETQLDIDREKDLASSDAEAERRYKENWGYDPCSQIAPALLNSADIFEYVKETGMIYPFRLDKLSGASYEVAVGDKVVWWDEKKKEKHVKELEARGDFFELKPNSIAFVVLEPIFRIPDYLALRFNLKISHVYKGLLLGTGPIVDPGFVGHLSIPLHNLTANTYIFHRGDGIIEMEFTKLSPNEIWTKEISVEQSGYKRQWIPPERNVEEYIARALGGSNSTTMVRSSIPDELAKVRHTVKKTRREAKSVQKSQNRRISGMQISTILLTIPVLAFACTAIYQLGTVVRTAASEQITPLEIRYQLLEDEVQKLDDIKDDIMQRLDDMEEQVNQGSELTEIRLQLEELTERLEALEGINGAEED